MDLYQSIRDQLTEDMRLLRRCVDAFETELDAEAATTGPHRQENEADLGDLEEQVQQHAAGVIAAVGALRALDEALDDDEAEDE